MSDWIDIDILTPDEDFEVIVCSGDDVTTAYFRSCDDGSFYFDNIPNVTHWMPLPEPPK